MNGIYRKKAIKKANSTEQLDKAIVISSPFSWVGIIGVSVFIIAVILWSVFTTIPTVVSTKGIYAEKADVIAVNSERVFAYACCTTESKDNFTAIKDYVFCGDIYEALKKTEISAGKIIQLIRNWCTGGKKENVLKMFEEYGADEKMIDVYRELYNQWHATSSLARVNALIMLKYFENK